MTTQMTDPVLTVAQAQARLPLVRRIVQDAVQLNRQITETRERLSEMRARRGDKAAQDIYAEEWAAIEQELESDAERLVGFSVELNQLGARLVDYSVGLVTFQSTRAGQPILLSWQFDEPRIAYCYEVDQTPADRVPLESWSLDARVRELGEPGQINRIEARFDEKA